jgi:prevent-host-death family protein
MSTSEKPFEQVNIYEAKTQLSALVDRAASGETIVIAKAGRPLARLVPLDQPAKPAIRFGSMKGRIWIADDFDAPLPDDFLDAFDDGGAP